MNHFCVYHTDWQSNRVAYSIEEELKKTKVIKDILPLFKAQNPLRARYMCVCVYIYIYIYKTYHTTQPPKAFFFSWE